MNLLFWAITLGTLGKVLVVIGVLFAHMKLAEERKVDRAVVHSLHTEKILTIVGLCLIILGYLLEMYFYGYTTSFFTCASTECSGTIINAFSK